MKQYFFVDKDKQRQGPFTLEEIADKVQADTLVWCKGMEKWAKASAVADFDTILNPPTPELEPAAEPVAEPTPVVEPTPAPEPTSEPIAEPTPEPALEPAPQPEPEPEPVVKPAPEPEPISVVKPAPEPTPASAPQAAAEEEELEDDAPVVAPAPDYMKKVFIGIAALFLIGLVVMGITLLCSHSEEPKPVAPAVDTVQTELPDTDEVFDDVEEEEPEAEKPKKHRHESELDRAQREMDEEMEKAQRDMDREMRAAQREMEREMRNAERGY